MGRREFPVRCAHSQADAIIAYGDYNWTFCCLFYGNTHDKKVSRLVCHHNFRCWHETDMLQQSVHVRYRGRTGLFGCSAETTLLTLLGHRRLILL